MCVYVRSYVWKIHDYRSRKKVYLKKGDASYVSKKKKTSKKQEISGAESHPTRRDFRHGLSVNLTSFTPDIDIEAKSLFCTNENIILP